MTIKIYSTQGSRGMRPIWTAEEMGLDYEVEMMPFPPQIHAARVHENKYPRDNSLLDRWKGTHD